VTPSATLPKLIDRYGNGGFRVSGASHAGSIVLWSTRVAAWPCRAADTIDPSGLTSLLEGSGAITVLIGTGARMLRLPADLITAMRASGYVAEPMDTGAACRTYNVLVGERRSVAAALIAV
jgi:uncharacterized protein